MSDPEEKNKRIRRLKYKKDEVNRPKKKHIKIKDWKLEEESERRYRRFHDLTEIGLEENNN